MANPLEEFMRALGLQRDPPPRPGQAWESETPHACGSRLTFDDGTGYTCVGCGQWRTGLSWKRPT